MIQNDNPIKNVAVDMYFRYSFLFSYRYLAKNTKDILVPIQPTTKRMKRSDIIYKRIKIKKKERKWKKNHSNYPRVNTF